MHCWLKEALRDPHQEGHGGPRQDDDDRSCYRCGMNGTRHGLANEWVQESLHGHADGPNGYPGEQCHLPPGRQILRGAEPRFESMQLAVHPLTLSEWLASLEPGFEQWRFIEVIAISLVGERSQDAEFRTLRPGRRDMKSRGFRIRVASGTSLRLGQ